MKFKNFFTESPKWHEKIGGIHALLERVKMSEDMRSPAMCWLRKLNRILSIHASTAIEGNRLTLGQVTDVINGKPVWDRQGHHGSSERLAGLQRNGQLFPLACSGSVRPAHDFMTQTLVGESGGSVPSVSPSFAATVLSYTVAHRRRKFPFSSNNFCGGAKPPRRIRSSKVPPSIT